MTDISLPAARPIRHPMGWGVPAALALLLLSLLAINWSAVQSMTERCESQQGPFSSGFGKGFDTDRRGCPAVFHFAGQMPGEMPGK
ncbi:hypothetical protein ACQR18_17525 [Bradyrhizobium oligotrophicum]|uniref:hypothetical protein n=1 Tax=Bradyrhizobium oligotrophicum TaxID=44255 RepID=UPI003EB85CE8